MPVHCARLVVLNLDRVGCLPAAIVWPGNASSQNVLGPLQPFKADHCCCSRLWMARRNCIPREFINLLARYGGLRFLDALFQRHALPWIGHVAIELIGIKPMHYSP